MNSTKKTQALFYLHPLLVKTWCQARVERENFLEEIKEGAYTVALAEQECLLEAEAAAAAAAYLHRKQIHALWKI